MEPIKIVEPAKDNPPAAPAPAPAPKVEQKTETPAPVQAPAPVAPVAPVAVQAPVAPPVAQNPPVLASVAPVAAPTVSVIAPATPKVEEKPKEVPLEDNPDYLKTVWDQSLIKAPKKIAFLEVASLVAGWYLSSVVSRQVYNWVKTVGPQFQYRNVLDHIVRILVEPGAGILIGSLVHSVGDAMGKEAPARKVAEGIITGSFVRGGVDAVDTAAGFAFGNPTEPPQTFIEHMVGLGNIIDLSGVTSSVDAHQAALEPITALSGAQGGEYLNNPEGFLGTESPYMSDGSPDVSGAGQLVDWATL